MLEKNMKRRDVFVKVSLVLTGVLLLLLAACQPQIIEVEKVVEVTRIVEVEVEIVKEVEKIVEVEVEKEVVEEEAAEEVSAEESAADGVQTGSEGVGATGSEEDDRSPFTPTTGKINTEQQVAQTISWIQSSGVITDPTTVRVIASRTSDVVLVMSVVADGVEQEIIVTNQIRRFRESQTAGSPGNANRIYMEMTPDEWEPLAEGIKLLLTTNLADGLACDFCAAGEAGESYALIFEEQVVRFQIDRGESVERLDLFLSAMRDLLASSSQRAQQAWSQAK